MNNIIRKAGMSILSGAACMLGSWVTKRVLDGVNDSVVAISKKHKENVENKENSPA